MIDLLIVLGEWALVAAAGAVSFGVIARRMAAEDAEKEADQS